MTAPAALLLSIGILASTTAGGGGGQSLTVNPDPAPAGSTVTLAGGCYSTASSFPISIAAPNGDLLASGSAPSDGSGDFSGTLTVPADATPGGGYSAFVVCSDIVELETTFSVSAAPGGPLPSSTSSTSPTTAPTTSSAPPTTAVPTTAPARPAAASPTFTG